MVFLAAAMLAAHAPMLVGRADQKNTVKGIVDGVTQPVMDKYAIPGMAVGLTVGGKRYILHYGVASRETRKPITDDTLFEIGSVSKAFTATLASWAQISGHLSLVERCSNYLPSLRGTKFGEVSLLNLGTHTSGGLPLQIPDNITTNDQLMRYFQEWRPTYAAEPIGPTPIPALVSSA
jgi:beta-lactamase class C